jgi:hypothetical protein
MSMNVVCTGDSVAALAMVLTEAEEQDRSSARAIEQEADKASMQQEDERVQAMRQKADDDASAALASGLSGIAGGAATVGSSFTSGASPGSPSSGPDWHLALDGAGKAAPSIGTLVSGGYKAAADRDDAAAAQFEAGAQAELRRYGEAHDAVQSATDSLQKVRDFLGQMQESENAARLAAAGLRG